MKTICLLVISACLLLSCTSQKKATGNPITGISFLGEYILPSNMQLNGTPVGGLSGIDYNAAENSYYLICDDRSDGAPARYYTAKIFLTAQGIDSVRLTGSTTLLQRDGRPYPNKLKNPYSVPDPEAMRLNPTNGTLVWSSEGERITGKGEPVLINPSVNIMNFNGLLIDTFPLPDNMRMAAAEKGPRQNGVFEGLAFARNYKTLFVSVEEPLYEDGPRAGLNDSAAWVRIIQYDVETKAQVAQYAYRIDAVVHEPVPDGAFKVNGVPDILAVNDHQLLVTERSFSTGHAGCSIRVYLAELNGAENIAGIASLLKHPVKNPVQKKLLLNMDDLHRYIDNIEGATFGPTLPNGRRSLLFVADDNFAPTQKTQFLLFRVNE